MYRVILTRKSLDDLERIEDFITLKSSAAIAQRYVSSIRRFLRDAADSTSPRRTARPSEEGTSQHRFQEAGLHLLSGIRFQEDGQHRPNLVRGLSRQKRMKYSARSQIRVAHPFVHFAKGWGIARSATALLCVATILGPAHAQSLGCGLTSVQESTPLTYPPIARAAHVEGPVVLLVTFEQDGSVSHIKIVRAPPLLDQLMGRVASEFVKGWKANSYSGPRECPVVIQFVIGPEVDNPKSYVTRVDLQHVSIAAETYHPTINYSIAVK